MPRLSLHHMPLPVNLSGLLHCGGRRLRATLFISAWLIIAGAAPAPGQNVQFNNKSVDTGLRGGAKVNPSTHALEIEIPLGNYPGRAGTSLPVTISYSSKVWRVAYQFYNPAPGASYTGASAKYAEHSYAGWTSSFGMPVIDDLKSTEQVREMFSPNGTPASINGCTAPNCWTIDRVLVRMPDGSTHEMRSTDEPLNCNPGNTCPVADDLYAVDGSRMRYQRSTQTLFMPDGSRYLLGSGQYIDRNGNTMTYNGSGWTDTLGRFIPAPPLASAAGSYTYSLPGVDGTPINYTFVWRNLGDTGVMTSHVPPRYVADKSSPGQTTPNSPALFGSSIGDSTYVSNASQQFDPVVLYQVILPTGQSYTFTYNVYGEIDKIVLPTGAYESYDHAGKTPLSNSSYFYAQGNRGVTARRVSAKGDGTDTATWTYSQGTTTSPIEMRMTTPDGTLMASYLYGDSNGDWGYGYNGALAGRPYEERVYSAPDAAGNRRMLRRKLTEWSLTGTNAFNASAQQATRNARVTKEVEILLDTPGDALAKTTTFGYDTTYEFTTGVNQTSVREYDYMAVPQSTAQSEPINSIPAPSLPLRITETANLDSNSAYRSRNILGLPASVTVKMGDGTTVAQTTMSYDEPAYQLGNAYGAVTQWADPGLVRGNGTTISRWLDTVGSYIQTHAKYDQCGSAVGSWDANGNQTQTGYSSNYAYAYPTSVTTPAPNPVYEYGYPAGTFGSTAGFTSTTAYDPGTGLVTSTTDANGKTTTFDYSDPFNRLKRVDTPDGGRTTNTYVDSHQCGAYVETRTLLDTTGRETDSYQFFDSLGRPYLSETYDGQDPNNLWLRVDTRYDPMGRVSQVSNPYRSSGCTAAPNPSGRWTTTEYDDLGRVKSVTTPDGARVRTAYSGPKALVTDQADRQLVSQSDALGRLTDVWEVKAADPQNPDPWLVSIPFTAPADVPAVSTGYRTSYTYDVLGNLRKVDQGGQFRFFMYDSLSRIIRAKNPEQAAGVAASNMTDSVTGNSQWSTVYGYDNDGNLTSRVDARGVNTSYTYDHLNRNVITHYTAPAGSGATSAPDARRYYDNPGTGANGLGRLYYSESVGVSSAVFDSYDPAGRSIRYHQVFGVGGAWGQPFYVTRTYDKAGNVTSQTYPSGRTVSYSYDAAGRLSGFSGNLGDGVQRAYASGITYSEFGGLNQEQFGTQTPLYHKLHYNRRGQLFDIRLSTNSLASNEWDWNRGAVVNYYGGNYAWEGDPNTPASADNNGNLRRSQTFVPQNEATTNFTAYRDTYEYDALNRLKSVSEERYTDWSGQTTPSFKQAYDYDRWGNRTVNTQETQVYGQNPGYTIPEPQFELSPQANQEVAEPSNRLYAPGDSARAPSQKLMRYDASGNLVYDSYTGQGTRVYDAENRMTQAQDSNQGWSTYTYDADGRRVKRASAGQETWQVYGMDGELLAEYQAGAAPIVATKEYGYRGGELLVTMSSGDDQRLRRFVTNLYYGALQRDPTAQELQDKSNQLAEAGVQGQPQLLQKAKDIARSLFTQTSYETSPYRSDSQYAADLYYTYLQRGPDDSGLSYWASQVSSSGRANVCNGFEASSEFEAVVSTLYGTAASDDARTGRFVGLMYVGAYGRGPTDAELQQRLSQLNAAAAQGQGQVQSQAEAIGRELFAAQVSDLSISAQQFVTNLYEGFLQRGPDAGGLSFWTAQAGTTASSREVVLGNFATCGPFRELAGTLYRESFWLVADHLGTPRMVLDKSGSLAGIKRHDYLSFGEELGAGVGGRTPAQGYGAVDNVRQRFAGSERDVESGLDYMEARYYSSPQGRFISVDPLMRSARVGSPQTFNRYSYALNNPLLFVDPSGEQATSAACKAHRCQKDEVGNTIYIDEQTGETIYVMTDSNTKQLPAPPAGLVGPVPSGATSSGVSTLTVPAGEAAPSAAPSAGATFTGSLFRYALGSLGLILLNPKEMGRTQCGGPSEICPEVHGPKVDAPANPDQEDNKPDTQAQPQTTSPPQMAKKSRRSRKERSTEIPSWAKGSKPNPGESGRDFAERVFREHGKPVPGPKERGPGSDFNKIKKFGDRNKP